MNAEDAICKMRAKYAGCHTYQDCGHVEGLMQPLRFKTHFERSGKFLFEWVRAGGPSYSAIWCDGINSYFYDDSMTEPKAAVSLPAVLTMCSKVSYGSAQLVASLLLPNVVAKFVDDRWNGIDAATEVNDAGCLHLSSQKDQIWVRKSDHSIQRYVSELSGSQDLQNRSIVRDEYLLRDQQKLELVNKLFAETNPGSEPASPDFVSKVFTLMAHHPERFMEVSHLFQQPPPASELEVHRTICFDHISFDEEIPSDIFSTPPWERGNNL